MYYRRKIVLAILETFGGELEKLQLQKLLMLYSKIQETPNFHFVPYKYDCFSFQANADLFTLSNYGIVQENTNMWKKVDDENYTNQLKATDKRALEQLKTRFKGKTSDELISYTYRNFPYYAINSVVAKKYLTEDELIKVNQTRPNITLKSLFTIGYEGLSLEEYINILLQAGVKVLCDVRKNSFSMKYGFSKSQLKTACEGVNIQFIHIPEVGIVSDKRKELVTQHDYDVLFDDYKQSTLPNTLAQQQFIVQLIEKNDRVALTCFEKDICQCHRKHLAESIVNLPEFKYELRHLLN